MTSSPPRPLSVSRSLAASWDEDVDRGRAGRRRCTPPASPATPIASAPWVPLTVTVSAAPSPPPFGPRRSSVDLRHVGAGQVVDGDVVGAAEGVEVDAARRRSRSMVMLATSRVKQTRPPLAEMSMFSAMLAPLKSIVSVPAWPSTMSLPSPGSHWKTSSPAPRRAMSLPWSPSTKSLPSPPSSVSAPWLPRIVSLPVPPSTVSLTTPAGSVVAVMASLPPRALTTSASLAPSEPVTLTRAGRPDDGERRCRRRRRR